MGFAKLDYCNSLYYNLPNSQLSRLQHTQYSLLVLQHTQYSLLVQLLKFPSSLTPLLFSNLSTMAKSQWTDQI